MTYQIDFESLAQRMIKDQSSFAHHLGELYIVADSKNKKKILEGFKEYFINGHLKDIGLGWVLKEGTYIDGVSIQSIKQLSQDIRLNAIERF